MTARRKRFVGVAGLAAAALCVVLVSLAGCKDITFNGDMKGFLEYWSSTVTVGSFSWEATPAPQRNSSGVYTIPTNAVVSVTASIENPDNYPLDYGVGSAADTLRSVRTAGAIGGTVRVTKSSPTSIELELEPFSTVPTEESLALEHRDFTLTVAPTRTDSGMQAVNPQVLTLRYNTPPRMPVEVVEEGGNLKLLGSDKWEMVQQSSTSSLNDKIYWAWPKDITDPTNPDCVAGFRVYQRDSQGTVVKEEEKATSDFLLDTVDPSLLSYATAVTNAGYNVYAASVTAGNEITIEAVDGEGVASQGTVSGRSPVKITLTGAGGTFRNGTQTAEVYKAQGAFVSGGDFETPQQVGSVLSGWSESVGGPLIAFPYEITGPKTLYALWRSDWSGYISSLGTGSHTVEIKDSLTEEDVYALRAAIASSPSAQISLDLSGATFPNNTLPAHAFDGEYTPQGTLSNLVGVTLPDNLAEIGECAFQNTGLTSVTIPKSVDTIGLDAFLGCDQLASVTIEDGVETIGQGAFHSCSALTSITIPSSVTSIGNWAFESTGLTSVDIPSSVTSIGEGTFRDCTSLTSVDIPGSVETIGYTAFVNCTSLTTVTIGEGVKIIDGGAFRDCTSLTSVTIPDSVETIRQDAFKNCSQLASVDIGDGVTSIETFAFQNTGLTSVTIPGNVLTIGQDAFSGCAQLTTVTLEDGVQTIGQGAFHSCPSLTSVTIPGSVQTIGQDAFCVCPALTTVTIADGVDTIGQGAFHSCPALTTVTIPGSVQTIGQDAFKNCSALTSVTIADGVQTIEWAAFAYTGLTSVTIPGSVQTIGQDAFYGCGQLKSVDIKYGVTSIGQAAFNGSGLTSVTIPGSVQTWGNHAFANCGSLASVTLEEGVPSIGHGVFDGCNALATITLPVSVTYIDAYNFRSASPLTLNYRGTADQWNAVNGKDSSSNWRLTNATKNYNYTGP